MQLYDADTVHKLLDYAPLVDALRDGFRAGCELPVRHAHTIEAGDDPDGILLLMPAWQPTRHVGVKVVTIFPGNANRGLPSVNAQYMLFDGTTGAPLALADGAALTERRTGCASALAASYMARRDASRLLMVGAGKLAPHLVRAHATVRPITHVDLWNRSRRNADALAKTLAGNSFSVTVVDDLEAAARQADVISCATLATDPLIRGDWLKPGAHLDLVGGYTPDMRETDDAAVRRARIFVDTLDGALAEAGDIVDPIRRGAIAKDAVRGDLFTLCREKQPGRTADDEVTMFKSVGTALEDLVAAQLVLARA
jgi:alanine dehydrogenase